MSAGWKNASEGTRRPGHNRCARCGETAEKRVSLQIVVRPAGAWSKGQSLVAQRARTICESCAQEIFAIGTDALLKDKS